MTRSVCCLLHNLDPGGSARQWIHLLGHHVGRGGRATILAPPGALGTRATAAGIAVVEVNWEQRPARFDRGAWAAVGEHDVAVVHWDHRVMDAFEPALAACGRAVLAIHQAPYAMSRWFGPEIVAASRTPIDRALADGRSAVTVRGESHRRRVASAFGLYAEQLDVLPASIPLPQGRFEAAVAEPVELLALVRLSPEKAPVAQLAVALTGAGLAAGTACRLAIAGEGPWRAQAEQLCRRSLPENAWRIEPAPADPIARLGESDLAVTQGLTTLEAAALGRRVVVARAVDEQAATGAALTPRNYAAAARDPFARPPLSADADRLWQEALAVDAEDLTAIRGLVERHNGLEAAAGALADILDGTTTPLARLRSRLPWS